MAGTLTDTHGALIDHGKVGEFGDGLDGQVIAPVTDAACGREDRFGLGEPVSRFSQPVDRLGVVGVDVEIVADEHQSATFL